MKNNNEKPMTVEAYKEMFRHRPTVSMDRCQFCDNFIKQEGGQPVIKGGCQDMKKRCIEAQFDTTEISDTCDNYANKDKKYL